MLRLSPEKIQALRQRLRERTAQSPDARAGLANEPETETLLHEYGPICEVMFLAKNTDALPEGADGDVIGGVLRDLDDRLEPAHITEMLRRAAKKRDAEGLFNRLDAIARQLDQDRVRGEVSYVLACAVIYADSDVTIDENGFLNDLADALGIDDARTEELQRMLL